MTPPPPVLLLQARTEDIADKSRLDTFTPLELSNPVFAFRLSSSPESGTHTIASLLPQCLIANETMPGPQALGVFCLDFAWGVCLDFDWGYLHGVFCLDFAWGYLPGL